MNDFEKAKLKLQCLSLARHIYIQPEHTDTDSRKEGIVYQYANLNYKVADEIYNYCVSQPIEKDVD